MFSINMTTPNDFDKSLLNMLSVILCFISWASEFFNFSSIHLFYSNTL